LDTYRQSVDHGGSKLPLPPGSAVSTHQLCLQAVYGDKDQGEVLLGSLWSAKADMRLAVAQAGGGGVQGDLSSPVSYKLSQGEDKPPSQHGLGIAWTWETWGCAIVEVLKAQQNATHWGNLFYQDGAII